MKKGTSIYVISSYLIALAITLGIYFLINYPINGFNGWSLNILALGISIIFGAGTFLFTVTLFSMLEDLINALNSFNQKNNGESK